MRFSAHPQRRTAFQGAVFDLDLLHGTCRAHSPWQNGIIERSHRTDNEELFEAVRFQDPEQRRYQLRLWEGHYACHRPHQALGNRTPFEVYVADYPLHASTRMLT
jgi:transposase InsO family protein